MHPGGPAEALEDADHRGGDVDLAGLGAVPCASGIGVMHVVPALPERHQGTVAREGVSAVVRETPVLMLITGFLLR